MLNIIMMAYMVGTIQFAYKYTSAELCAKVMRMDLHWMGRVSLLVLLAPAMAGSLIGRASVKLFVGALAKYEKTYNAQQETDQDQ